MSHRETLEKKRADYFAALLRAEHELVQITERKTKAERLVEQLNGAVQACDGLIQSLPNKEKS